MGRTVKGFHPSVLTGSRLSCARCCNNEIASFFPLSSVGHLFFGSVQLELGVCMQMRFTADLMGGNQADRLRLPMRLLISPDVYVPPAAKKLMQLSIKPSAPAPTKPTSIPFQGESAHFALSQQSRRLKLPREELLIWPRSCSAAWLHPAGIRNFAQR